MHRPLPLYPALRASVLTRDVATLQRLLRAHGATAFADALSSCSPRVAADVLSLLPMPDRLRVHPHLPSGLRSHVRPLYRTGGTHVAGVRVQSHLAGCSA